MRILTGKTHPMFHVWNLIITVNSSVFRTVLLSHRHRDVVFDAVHLRLCRLLSRCERTRHGRRHGARVISLRVRSILVSDGRTAGRTGRTRRSAVRLRVSGRRRRGPGRRRSVLLGRRRWRRRLLLLGRTGRRPRLRLLLRGWTLGRVPHFSHRLLLLRYVGSPLCRRLLTSIHPFFIKNIRSVRI